MSLNFSLSQLGWQPFFLQQLTLEEWEHTTVARVAVQHRSQLTLISENGYITVPVTPAMPPLTVGDWILLDSSSHFLRALQRSSQFERKAVNSKVENQLIAANIDTVFIVDSMNHNFSLNRLERYLVLAHEAQVEPVIVLTKSDLCTEPQQYIEQARSLDIRLDVAGVDSHDASSLEFLKPYCRMGKTVAFLGSSGVGKSTLVNTLTHTEVQKTGAIREQDSKGRHTTTVRSLHLMPGGGLLLDTPGMRELQLTVSEQGLEETFAEIYKLAEHCRFSDCQHQTEPGCQIRAAIETGKLSERQFKHYSKLQKEQALQVETLAEKRQRGRKLSQYYKRVLKEQTQFKKQE